MVGGEKMKNPLTKRLPRELKGDIGKYIVIFLFMTMTRIKRDLTSIMWNI